MRIGRSGKERLLGYRDGGVTARHPWKSLEAFILILFREITLTTAVHDAILLAKGKRQCFWDKGPAGAGGLAS